MELGDVAADVVFVQMGVNLSGSDAFVSEHLLYGAEVGASFHEVGGEGVPEGVRADGLFDACLLRPLFHEYEDHFTGEVAAAAVEKHVVFFALLILSFWRAPST